ncbi:glutamate 5-kinase [Campylobacter mucosalis]|uniref:glutamate 5-kinase n=1 Tax=Campylobacter mucosalis TaxID=202 RepID=UPI0014707947|nr:glutamate 5-kinase [Campylobacter mucosalis]
MRKELFKNIKRIVVKVGTSTLTNSDGTLNESLIKSLVAQICAIKNLGYEVILVTSGAVGAGMGRLGVSVKPKNIAQKQALAAVGQVALMHLYERVFWAYSRTIAQLLLTRADFDDRKRYLNARNVCNALLTQGIVPIINENDPVVADELKVGDNDTLSALVCGLTDADLLIILSDIDGLYTANPNNDKNAKLLNLVQDIDENIIKMASGEGSKFGTGGMATKISAAKIATRNGTNMLIANGKTSEILTKIINGDELGTLFLAKNGVNSRKFWVAFGASKKGVLVVDDGASTALKNGKSLLAVGIKKIVGEFERGFVVDICTTKNEVIASGITNYSSDDMARILGLKSDEFEAILGHKTDDEIIHADNVVVKV